MALLTLVRKKTWSTTKPEALLPTQLNAEFNNIIDTTNTNNQTLAAAAAEALATHDGDVNSHVSLQTFFVGDTFPDVSSHYRFCYILSGDDKGKIYIKDASSSPSEWTLWFHEARLALDARDGGTFQAATVSDGAITAAKMSGAQTGDAPAFAVRAWGSFNSYLNASVSPPTINATAVYATFSIDTETTITISSPAHGFLVNHRVSLNFTSGTNKPADGLYNITVADTDTFTISVTSKTGRSGGNLQYYTVAADCGNCRIISRQTEGENNLYRYIVNLIKPIDKYAVTCGAGHDNNIYGAMQVFNLLPNSFLLEIRKTAALDHGYISTCCFTVVG